jgi:hypothetical protein
MEGTGKYSAQISGQQQGSPMYLVAKRCQLDNGYLLKYKARLVVRGDLQEQYSDTYAATLAARLFRALMALTCAFSLKAMQYDVPNAFLNALLDRTLYVRTPDGF